MSVREAIGLGASSSPLVLLHVTIVLILGSVILEIILADKSPGNSDDTEQPEEVQGLKRTQESGSDDLSNTALVLLGIPVQFKGTDSLEFGKERPDDLEVEVVTQVDPSDHEDSEIRAHERRVNVVERFGSCQEEVTNVVGDVDSQADVSEMEAVAQANESKGNNVMTNKFLKIFARLLHTKEKNNSLLSPVGCLEKIVEFDRTLMS